MNTYSQIKLLEYSFQPIRRHNSGGCCCCIQKTVDEAWSFHSFDGSNLLLQRKVTAQKVCILISVSQDNIIPRAKSLLFDVRVLKPDFEMILISVRELPLV